MVPPAVPIRPEELLQHAGWLGALAASLVADPAAADDLVQDTFVAALRRPPVVGGGAREWTCEVFAGRTTAHDLELPAKKP